MYHVTERFFLHTYIYIYTLRCIEYDVMVNIISSQLRRPHPSMTSEETSRTCYMCKKLFCCALCRERHEEKKHMKRQPNCPICTNQKLPLKAFEDQALLYHMVTTHLPLYCYLCGEIFKQSKDLESFGTCKWWKSQQRRSLISEQKSMLGTPPLTSEGQESSEYNGNFGSLTSPPELYRNTSTPMVVGQKTSFDFKTPNASNFSLKTPKIDSTSVKNSQTSSDLQESNSKSDNSNSNYMSFPSATVHKETPFRVLPSNHGDKQLSRNKSQKQGIMKDKNDSNPSKCYIDNNCVEDMELTNIENEVLPDSQSLEIYQGERRSESLKKVRFSDQYENPVESNSVATFNMTENEEYFEACDTLSEMKQSLEKSQIKIYEDNARNTEKENRSPDRANVNDKQQSSGTSRVVMMVVVENNSNVSTSELIDSGLRKLDRVISNTNFSSNSQSYSSCSSSLTSIDSCYSISRDNYYSHSNDTNNPPSRSSNTPPNSNAGSSGSTGLLSVVTNAVKSVMKNFAGFSRNIEEEQASSRVNVTPTPSTSESSMLNFASSILQRPGKRPRDVTDYAPSTQRQTDFVVPQVELRSPLAKRHRGWYKIKGREPIARMRNRQHPSPRGVSSETQVFHQGSLSVGNTVLPLPDRAHQSTQTE